MKRAYVLVTPEFIGEICKPTNDGAISIESILPKDAKFISAHYVFDIDCFKVLFEHESFEDVSAGERYHQLQSPIFTKHDVSV